MSNISVICSNYNSSSWIEGYLKSLNAQFLQNFEVLFVDANSTDNSLDTITDFDFREGIKVQILSEKERISVYQAWNKAIQQASCPFIVNYNTDDLLFPSALSTYEGYIKNNPLIDLFYSPCFVNSGYNPLKITEIRLWPPHDHNLLKTFCYCGPFPCVRKSAIESVGLFDVKYRSSSDYDMWLKLSHNGFKFMNIPEVVGTFYFRKDSVSNDNIASARLEDIEIQMKY